MTRFRHVFRAPDSDSRTRLVAQRGRSGTFVAVALPLVGGLVAGCGDDVSDPAGTGGDPVGADGASTGGTASGSGGGGSVGCTDQYVFGLGIAVRGAASGAGAGGMGGVAAVVGDDCAVEVTIADGDYTETPDCFARDDVCHCSGAGERSGDYVVTATLGGETQTEAVTVQGGDCHVTTETVAFEF